MVISNFSGKNSCSGSELWQALEKGEKKYSECNHQEKNTLVRHFAPTVQKMAVRLKNRLPPHIELEDLVAAGLQGLFYAFKHFAEHFGVPLEAYAVSRIRGMMLDELRRQDWLSRGMRSKIKQLEELIVQQEVSTGISPTTDQLASLSGLDKKEVSQLLETSQANFIIDFDQLQENLTFLAEKKQENEPVEAISRKELIEQVTQLLQELPEREQLLLSLYYEQELTMREVAEILEVTEGRVSQLHARIVKKLKKNFRASFICTERKN